MKIWEAWSAFASIDAMEIFHSIVQQ